MAVLAVVNSSNSVVVVEVVVIVDVIAVVGGSNNNIVEKCECRSSISGKVCYKTHHNTAYDHHPLLQLLQNGKQKTMDPVSCK